MLAIDRETDEFLYQQVIDLVDEQVRSGALLPGDRLPSLRRMSDKLGVSLPVVRQAYLELEARGRIEARPKSGYFVQARRQSRLVTVGCKDCKPVEVRCRRMIDRVFDAIHQPGVLPLGIANPCMALPATRTLHRAMKRVMSRAEDRVLSYAPMLGDPGLKHQIAYRYLNQGGAVDPDDIIITNGGQEALSLALQCVARGGDVVAVESPTYMGLLELIESLDMKALEIETCPLDGVNLDALERALDQHEVRACLFASSLNNPLGSATSDEHRERLVALLEDRDIPLIEDDVYGELMFEGPRPRPAQFMSRKGGVMTCGSFSKTAAPGYRIGWLLPGRYAETASKLKRALSCSSGLLPQLTLAEHMAVGDYDRHLNRLKPALKGNAERMMAAIERGFPAETRLSKPQGGSVLWVEMPRSVDSTVLFDAALDAGISIMPGTMFAARGRYRHCIRLSFGHPWSEVLDQGLERLGALVSEMALKTT